MAQFTRTTPQTLTQNQFIAFDATAVSGGCKVWKRTGSGLISAAGSGCHCKPRIYRVIFHGNVVGAVGSIQLAIFQDGVQLPETLMAVVPGGAADVWSVDASTEVRVDCNCSTIGVALVSANTVTANTASLIIKEVTTK